jgi:hypothetical protein
MDDRYKKETNEKIKWNIYEHGKYYFETLDTMVVELNENVDDMRLPEYFPRGFMYDYTKITKLVSGEFKIKITSYVNMKGYK